MKVILVLVIGAHGIAHLVGFLVSWRLMASPDVPYHTTLLAGRLDIGDAGTRAMGALWLLAAAGCILAAYGLWTASPWATTAVYAVLSVSLVMCLIAWPEARIGAWVNAALLLAVVTLPRLGWLSLDAAGSR